MQSAAVQDGIVLTLTCTLAKEAPLSTVIASSVVQASAFKAFPSDPPHTNPMARRAATKLKDRVMLATLLLTWAEQPEAKLWW
jgi:hypothetical protein